MFEQKEKRVLELLQGVWQHLLDLRVDMWRRVYASKEVEDYPPRRLFLERHCEEVRLCCSSIERVLREDFQVGDDYFQHFRFQQADDVERPTTDIHGLIKDEDVRLLKEVDRLLERAERGRYNREVDKDSSRLIMDLRDLRVRFEDLTCLKLMRNKG